MAKDSTLQKHIDNDKIAPSYLLLDKDISKLRGIADWFSKTNMYNKADIFWLVPKDGSNTIQVKETELFMEQANLAAIGGSKLFIICDASTMTISAQNKILKTIEDAPASTCFMLLASNAEPILHTIKSRCAVIYPDPTPRTAEPNSPLSTAVKSLLECRTLDEALPLLPILTKDVPTTLQSINTWLGQNRFRLSPERNYDIIKKLSIINRNVLANCNAKNAFDILLMELFKNGQTN